MWEHWEISRLTLKEIDQTMWAEWWWSIECVVSGQKSFRGWFSELEVNFLKYTEKEDFYVRQDIYDEFCMLFVTPPSSSFFSADRLLPSTDEAYFFGAGGAIGWPISLPRSFMPRTRSILPRMMLFGIPLKERESIIVEGSPMMMLVLTFQPRSRWLSAASHWSWSRDPSGSVPLPGDPAGCSGPRCCQCSCASILQSHGRVSQCFGLANVACWFRHWLKYECLRND